MGSNQSTAAKRSARALSPVRGLNRKGVDHPIKSANLDSKKATAVHVPIVEVENAVNEPVNKDPPVSVMQYVQSLPLEDIAKAVEDTADVPAKKDSPPRIELKFPEGTLGTEIQSEPLEHLAKAFEAMIAKMAEASGSDLDVDYFIRQIDDITVKASSFSAKAQAFLEAVPSVSSAASETIEKVMATIDGDVSDFLNRPIKGIADDNTRKSLVKASENVILCLTDAAILFTEYMDTPGTTWSNIAGSNKNKLDEMKARLADVQEAHKSAKDKGLFTIMVTVASDVVDTKEVVHEVARRVENIDATLQAHAKESEEKKLQQLCQKRDPHRGEVTALVNRCTQGTRKWIVDQVLESIEKGEEKITWLRCEAGTGKSVIAGRVAQELKQKRLLGATFFCKFNDNKSNNMVGLIQTIAFELANVNDQFRTALIKTLENWGFQDVNENKKAMPNTEKLLQLFLEEPMEAWPKTLSLVVVIDALDEIKNISEDIHLLLGAFLRLESVKLFITSRPEIKDESIEISTATKKSSVALVAFKQNDKRNLEDIQMFATSQVDMLFAKFPAFGTNERKQLVEMLVENSTGLFIWIALVLGNVDGHDSQLDKLTGAKKKPRASVVAAHVRYNSQKLSETSNELANRLEAHASLGLQDYYCRAFSEAFLDVDNVEKELWLKLFKASVGTLMVLKVPMSRDQLPYLVVSGDDDMFDEILASLDQISALLHVDDNDKLSFVHKSVQDYLIGIALSHDKSHCDNLSSIHAQLSMDVEKRLASIDKTVSDYRKGIASWTLNSHECIKDISFKLDFGEIHFNVAMSCLKLLNTALHKNMAEPNLDGLLNYSDGRGYEWTIDKESLTESVQYAILYWSDHFVDAVKMVDANQQEQLLVELERFCKTQLLYYLEAILLLKKLDLVPRVVNSILSCLGDIQLAGTPSAELPSSDLPSADMVSRAVNAVLSRFTYTGIPSSNNHSAANIQFISSILQDLKLVSINFRPQLMVSPLQVYNHALIFVPQQSEYYITYHQMASARITIGAKQNWGPMTLFGHMVGVISVAISLDGKTVISGSRDKTVKVWDMQKGTSTRTLKGHFADVTSVAISRDSRTIVSGSTDNTVKVWDMQKGTCTRTLEGHSDKVTSVAISPDSRIIVSGSTDNTMKVWDMQKGTCTRTLEGLEGHSSEVASVAISPDGRIIVSGSRDNTVKVWDMQKGTCMETLKGHSDKVTAVAISPDGSTIVSASWDNTVKVWDLQKGTCTRTLIDHSAVVNSVAISPDGRTIVSGLLTGTVKVWDMQKGTCTVTLNGHSSMVNSVAISPDGRTIVSGSRDKTVKVWDMPKGTSTVTLEGLEGHSDNVTSVAISPDGGTTVSGSWDKTVKVWDMQKGTCTQTLMDHSAVVNSVAISPDGRTIVSGSLTGTVKVWDMQKGTCTATLNGHSAAVTSVAISPDGRTIVSGSLTGTVKVWDIQKGTCMQTLEGHSDKVTSVTIRPDGRTIVSSSWNGKVKVWGMQNGSHWVTLDSGSKFAGSIGISPEKITLSMERDWLVSGEALLVSGHFSIWNVAQKVAVFADGKNIAAVVVKEEVVIVE
ncbi:hypothetical protein HDU77_001472 [Chytriomyces hyalinus]|nr:hypothetical protein HDU77_001472 [Chytriomyces hyalinus]